MIWVGHICELLAYRLGYSAESPNLDGLVKCGEIVHMQNVWS